MSTMFPERVKTVELLLVGPTLPDHSRITDHHVDSLKSQDLLQTFTTSANSLGLKVCPSSNYIIESHCFLVNLVEVCNTRNRSNKYAIHAYTHGPVTGSGSSVVNEQLVAS